MISDDFQWKLGRFQFLDPKTNSLAPEKLAFDKSGKTRVQKGPKRKVRIVFQVAFIRGELLNFGGAIPLVVTRILKEDCQITRNDGS